ncbi:hypothetical protein DSO57_1023811 [Entomophthora muscae]|uniref:Uncharacterized protein n=1 Tax=Entomophthora muscae TaxID=34485 RepID=A0ACC2UD74_9FUNG|nr:hypothetical protein DSO57_1023811 [Entomophthora muscae]
MIEIPVGFTLVKLNLEALFYLIEEKLPKKWIPDRDQGPQRDDNLIVLKGEFKIHRLTQPLRTQKSWAPLGMCLLSIIIPWRCWEDADCNPYNKFDFSSPAPEVTHFQETKDQPPELYCCPGVLHSLVYFTEYPLNPDYVEFILEEILFYNPEAQTRETKLIGYEGTWITIQPLLFCGKYNHLPTYLVPMTPPLTPQPNHPQKPAAISEYASTQIFGVLYIIFISLNDSMVPSRRPWAIL